MPRLTAIAIVAANGVIGDGRDQPFKFTEDWARYKRVTMGHPMIMGRVTHEAIGRALPGRTTIVLTRDPTSVRVGTGEDVRVAASLDEALELAADLDDEVAFVAGGGAVYRAAWEHLTHLDITEVRQDAEGSVLFPEIDPRVWREVRREPRERFDFVGYERCGSPSAGRLGPLG